MVKNLPAMQETQVQYLDQEDPLEEEMATNSSILAWEIHGQRSLMGYSCKESDTTERLHFHFHVQDSLCSPRQKSVVTLLLKGDRLSTHTSANIAFAFYIAGDISGETRTDEDPYKKKITWGTTGLDN